MKKLLVIAAGFSLALAGCSQGESDGPAGDPNYEAELQALLLDAKPGDVITIPEGVFTFTRSLSLTVDGVTIRGAGMNKSILSFKDQVAGAEGLLVTANDFTIENLAIEDTIGDALKISEGNNIVIRAVRVEWTGGPDTKNGAYGIYPVQTTNVLMEDNVAIGASDAGLYIGQSANVIVRRNQAKRNVAGIEIENTVDADVYQNLATENTGGILVFNMPHLQQEGKRVRVFDNKVVENNLANFGHEGTPVASVPAGSGVMVNSHDQVEIFNNEIGDNDTANIIIASVYSTNYAEKDAVDGYDPYPEAISIYGNTLSGGGGSPDGLDLKALKTALYGPMGSFPDVLWDGYVNKARLVNGTLPADQQICVGDSGIKVLNADSPNGNSNPREGGEEHNCTLPRLPAIVLASAEE